MIQEVKVNFYPLVYFQSIDFISRIQLQLFLAKLKTKVYIQKLMDKEIKTPVIKKEKARFMLAFFI
ncbi:hypothetical protein BAGA_26115 [Bacillus gaemokensis]|uniref:Uncharacterized protein n=1 Tax=Bacillus gaemokensis TaxID=574375 RepID=A0A073K5A8_9BACI|nr:hypothetical protein BAGA_26115 [Bacillus gaemokensis]KYG33851.1 hypothetical protein AZF08_26990 [Bacillus gaemokensis]